MSYHALNQTLKGLAAKNHKLNAEVNTFVDMFAVDVEMRIKKTKTVFDVLSALSLLFFPPSCGIIVLVEASQQIHEVAHVGQFMSDLNTLRPVVQRAQEIRDIGV